MKNYWLEEAKRKLDAESQSGNIHFDRLKAEGIINERGEVVGERRRWDAFLAITEVKRDNGLGRIPQFRCLKPVFGIPGDATIDISRDSIVDYLRQGKKIITADYDSRLKMWIEGEVVRLSPTGCLKVDESETEQDDLGSLPEYRNSTSRL